MYAFVMKNIRTITFASIRPSRGAAESARFLAGIAECEGAEMQILENYPLPLDALQGQDLCVAVGGDGTLLGVLNAALEADVAVLGVMLASWAFWRLFHRLRRVKVCLN